MKKVTLCLMSLMVVVLLSSAAFTAECFNVKGSAFVPNIYTYRTSNTNWRNSHMHISNITDSEVTCRVTVYDGDGNDLSSFSKVLKDGGGTTSTLVTSGTGTFTIPAQSTRVFSFHYDNLNKFVMGHATIEWTSTNKTLHKALVAGYRSRTVHNSSFEAQFAINNGQPF